MPPSDPKSSYQLDQRSRLSMVQIGMSQMTGQQRKDWDRFAATVPHFADGGGRDAQHPGQRALRLYRSAQLNRLAMGLPIQNSAPVRKCTMNISAVEADEPPVAGQIAFRLFHKGGNTEGIRVLVEMTRAMKTERRKPLERELTRAGATDLGSYFALGENGATYVLDTPRYAIAPGQRYGLRVTLVTEEGLRSPSLFSVMRAVNQGTEGTQRTEGTKDPSLAAASWMSFGSVTSLRSFINPAYQYPLPPAQALPSRQEVQQLHRAIYGPARRQRPESAGFLAEEVQRQAAFEEQMRHTRLQMEDLRRQRADEHLQQKLERQRDHSSVDPPPA